MTDAIDNNRKALPWLLKLTQLRHINFKKRKKSEIIQIRCYMILVLSSAITVKKLAITPTIIQSQKTNIIVDNLFVND